MAAKRKSDYTEILDPPGPISRRPTGRSQTVAKNRARNWPRPDAAGLCHRRGSDAGDGRAARPGLRQPERSRRSRPRSSNWCPSRSPAKTPILPLSEADGKLTVIVSDPMDYDTFDKLRFILNRQIEIALAPREAILEAINRHYGQTVGESADSMLQEFTDTAIDFTETDAGGARAAKKRSTRAAPRSCGWCN